MCTFILFPFWKLFNCNFLVAVVLLVALPYSTDSSLADKWFFFPAFWTSVSKQEELFLSSNWFWFFNVEVNKLVLYKWLQLVVDVKFRCVFFAEDINKWNDAYLLLFLFDLLLYKIVLSKWIINNLLFFLIFGKRNHIIILCFVMRVFFFVYLNYFRNCWVFLHLNSCNWSLVLNKHLRYSSSFWYF